MAGHGLKEIGAAQFEGETLRERGTWVVEFGAEWCPPCRVIEPVLGRLAVRHAGRLGIAQVDADAENELAVTFGVHSVPTLLVFRDGTLVDRFVGALPEAQLERRLAPHLA